MRSIQAAVLCAAGSILVASAAVAAGRVSQAEATYRSERAACVRGDTGQERATCMKEASAALAEARRGNLNDGKADYERNRLQRCEQQPAEDREACVRRMNGEGTVSGSVQGGGIYRELVVPVR